MAFAVSRDDVGDRIDTHFHHPYFRNLVGTLQAVGSKTLGAFVQYSNETWDKTDGRFTEVFPYIEISRVGLGTNEYQVSRVSVSEAPSRARQVVRTDDILVSLTRPHRGAVLRVLPDHDGSIASTGFAVVRTIDSEHIDRDYLWMCLIASFSCDQMLMRSSGGNYPAITKDELSQIFVPDVELERQFQLVATMSAARANRKAMLAEADALLAGTDESVLDALGIKPSVQQLSVFAVSTADVQGSRFDSDFHSLRFRTIRNGIERGRYPSKSIDELCQYITSGFAAGPQDQAFGYENGIPHLRPLNLDVFGQISLDGTKFVPKSSVAQKNRCVRGEVLFNNTNSTEMVGKSAVFDLDQPCACSNHVTRLKPYSGVSAEYIASALNALRRIGYLGLLSTNFNNQAGINATTLSQLHLPTPPMEEQNAIAAEVRRRRQESRRLRVEAESGWQDAKRWFEAQLLGNAIDI